MRRRDRLSLLFAALGAGCSGPDLPASLPEVVLRVAGEPITRTEIDTLAAFLVPDNPGYALDHLRSAALARALLPRATAFAILRDRVEAARERIARAKARLEAGEAFEAVAKDLSDHAPEKGGDAGWLARRDFDPLLAFEAFEFPVGEVRGPIATRVGFSLLRVSERRSDPRPGHSTVHLFHIVAGLEPQPKSLPELSRSLESLEVEVLDSPLFDRIRPPGLAFRYAPAASRPTSRS
ncbi:MAG: peptidyl-prolyl cis-trans isomerase [Planctomycetes bacterium]|nr:peptidyl-prolyl cis-trans isomerase [Planctomycetota bacterium]